MSYLTVVSRKTKARCSDGTVVPCDYLRHRRFRHDCHLSAGLHYLFIRYSKGRTYARAYALRTAIKMFLDYTIEYEQQNPTTLHLTSLSQVSPEVFYGYDSFIKSKQGPEGLATRLKSALKAVAQNSDEGMPILALPLLDDPQSKVHEPLTETCFQQLSAALQTHIDNLYAKLAFRSKVNAAKPYLLAEVMTVAKKAHAWVPDDARSLKTLIANGHPFAVPHDEYVRVFRRVQITTHRPALESIVELIYTQYHYPAITREVKRKKTIKLAQLLDLFYPTAVDQAAIALFIQLQTGWNKETVMAVDGRKFEHVLTRALSTKKTLITSEKQKSQSAKKPYLTPKVFLAPSSKDDKYSAYNLIKLAMTLSAPLAELPVDCTNHRIANGFNPLFMVMRDFDVMAATTSRGGTRPGRFISITYQNAWESGVTTFLEKYDIREHGRRLSSVGELSGRLRPTWIRYVRDKNKSPLSIVALQQGHKSIETTDVHYDSSGPAMQRRRERLEIELTKITELLRERKFKGLIGKKNDTSLNVASFRIFTVPGHEKSLWACTDSFRPDWPGSTSRLGVGEKCSEIHRCLFCSRVCVFEDSLPFLMHRQQSIQEQLESVQEPEFNSPLSDELRIIEYILDEWGDERALKEAARYLRLHPDLLPSDINSLSTLMED